MNTAEREQFLKLADYILDGNIGIHSTIGTEANSLAILNAINNLALPTEDQYSLIRYLEGGTATSVSNIEPLPVKISSATGDINITAGDLNVQLSHLGASFDSSRIGDGVELLEINTDGSINTKPAVDYDMGDVDANTIRTVEASDSILISTLTSISNKLNNINVLDKYAIAREDTTSVSNWEYYGFKTTDGSWYILAIDLGGISYLYANGISGTFDAAWLQATAGTLGMDEFDNLSW